VTQAAYRRADRPTTIAAFMLLVAGVVALQLARAGENRPGSFVLAGLACAAAIALTRVLLSVTTARRWIERTPGRLPLFTGVACLLTLLLSFAGAISLANEERLMAVLLCVGASIFAIKTDVRSMSQVAILGALVSLFSMPAIRHEWRVWLVIALAAVGMAFLLVHARRGTGRSSSRVEWAYAFAIAGVVIGCTWLGYKVISPRDDNPWYAAVAPTSGGPDNEAGDENARRGIGDGPDEIAGDSPESVGFDQSDNFAESGKDGLYDLWVESYGEPAKSEDQQKMIGLKPQDVNVVVAPDRENLKVGRSFKLRRDKPKPASTTAPVDAPADAPARAALFVKGPLPAYIPLAVFHDFDGDTWTTLPHGNGAVPVRPSPQQPGWLDVLQRPLSPAFDQKPAIYSIKIGNLGQAILPLPGHVERFKMGRVNRPDFFSSTRSGLIRMSRRTLPAGATLDVSARVIVPARLRGVEPALPRNSDADVLDISTIDPAVIKLARQWSGEHAGPGNRGWRQIEAVLLGLRSHVTFDSNLDTSGMTRPVEDLLLVNRRGSDHQIASAAVVLLRSMGYATRLVSGLYADETHVDAKSGYAVMTAKNVHFWIEVRLADGTWVTLDPTPGYPMIAFPRTVGEWLAVAWTTTTTRLRQYWIAASLTLVTGVLLFVSRRFILDAFATVGCRWRGCSPLAVLRLIELRARLAGRPRPANQPVGPWLDVLLKNADTDRPFARVVDRALYSNTSSNAQIAKADQQLCHDIVRRHTIRAIRSTPGPVIPRQTATP